MFVLVAFETIFIQILLIMVVVVTWVVRMNPGTKKTPTYTYLQSGFNNSMIMSKTWQNFFLFQNKKIEQEETMCMIKLIVFSLVLSQGKTYAQFTEIYIFYSFKMFSHLLLRFHIKPWVWSTYKIYFCSFSSLFSFHFFHLFMPQFSMNKNHGNEFDIYFGLQ